jgi:hypothetical protein
MTQPEMKLAQKQMEAISSNENIIHKTTYTIGNPANLYLLAGNVKV